MTDLGLTVSGDCLPMLTKMAPRNVMPSLFMYAPPKGGVLSVLSPQSVFLHFWIVGGIFPLSHLLNPFAVRNSHILSMKV